MSLVGEAASLATSEKRISQGTIDPSVSKLMLTLDDNSNLRRSNAVPRANTILVTYTYDNIGCYNVLINNRRTSDHSGGSIRCRSCGRTLTDYGNQQPFGSEH